MEQDNIDKNWCIVILKFIGFYWRGFFVLLWPIACLAVFYLGFEEKFRCLYCVFLMSGYWVTECIPLYVTGLIPICLIPMFNIQSTKAVCLNYFTQTNMFFLASVCIALAIEESGLHQRIAYTIIMFVGCSPRRLHFGLTLVTSVLSMWLTNSATTTMMCPITYAILEELEAGGIGTIFHPKAPTDHEEDPPKPTNMTIAFFLSAAFASTVGGLATLVGTDTNLTYKGIYESRFPDAEEIKFVPWMLFNTPIVIAMSVFTWFSLEFVFLGLFRPKSEIAKMVQLGTENQHIAYNLIKTKKAELGPMKFVETGVAILFVLIIFLWLSRDPQFLPGWASLYKTQISDGTPAIAIIILFAALPASFEFFEFCTLNKTKRPHKSTKGLIPWKFLEESFPWGLLFLLSGGFALADAGIVSGMSTYLGEKLSVMADWSPIVVLCITSAFASFATEVTANVAICNIVIPVLIDMCVAMKIHPLKFTLPAGCQCSMAFLLPVGTPPNAIILGYSHISTIQMIKGGILLKIFSYLLYVMLFPSYGLLFYDIAEFPDWATANATELIPFLK